MGLTLRNTSGDDGSFFMSPRQSIISAPVTGGPVEYITTFSSNTLSNLYAVGFDADFNLVTSISIEDVLTQLRGESNDTYRWRRSLPFILPDRSYVIPYEVRIDGNFSNRYPGFLIYDSNHNLVGNVDYVNDSTMNKGLNTSNNFTNYMYINYTSYSENLFGMGFIPSDGSATSIDFFNFDGSINRRTGNIGTQRNGFILPNVGFLTSNSVSELYLYDWDLNDTPLWTVNRSQLPSSEDGTFYAYAPTADKSLVMVYHEGNTSTSNTHRISPIDVSTGQPTGNSYTTDSDIFTGNTGIGVYMDAQDRIWIQNRAGNTAPRSLVEIIDKDLNQIDLIDMGNYEFEGNEYVIVFQSLHSIKGDPNTLNMFVNLNAVDSNLDDLAAWATFDFNLNQINIIEQTIRSNDIYNFVRFQQYDGNYTEWI